MPAVTTTQQTREAVVVDGKTQFKITIQVTDKGPLPTKSILVISIDDALDPKSDSFGRVASITDLTKYGEDRAQAVRNKQTLYRTDTWVFYYDDLDTAVNATDVLKTRIDEFVTNWETYDTQFEATSEVTEHPRTGLDTFNTLVDAYTNAASAESSALTAMNDAKTAYDTAVTDAASAASDVTKAQTLYDNCVTAKGYFDACLAGFSTLYDKASIFGNTGTGAGQFLTQSWAFRNAAHTLRAACTGTPPSADEKATYDAAEALYNSQINGMSTTLNTFNSDLVVAEAAKNKANADQALFTAFCATRLTELNNAKTAKATADTNVANARTAYESAQAAYASAQAATEAALAAVRALKPMWTPTNALPGSSTTT